MQSAYWCLAVHKLLSCCYVRGLQDRDAMLEKLRQTCNGQRDYITRQADEIRNLNKSLQDVTISSQRQVPHWVPH